MKNIQFKKHKNSNNAYCSNCGSQLEERVQKVDLSDYDAEIQYFWDTPLFRISFPIVLPTHTESRVFTCHKCKSEFSFEEQLIYKELQKKCEKNKLFTKDEIINQTINCCVKKINKKNLFLFIISTIIVLIALALTILILTNDYISPFFISIPFLLFFFFDILNNNRRDNLLKKKCFLMISKNQTNLKEFINFEYEKVELKKRITSLLTFLIIPASSTILFMSKSCCKFEYNFTLAIISVITWIFFFVGLRRVIKLVTFIKEERNN